MKKNQVLKKNTLTNAYELNLSEDIGTKECINILNSELLSVNREIYDLEMKKQTILELIDQKNRQRRKEDEEFQQMQEQKNKMEYLNKIKPNPNFQNNSQEELRSSKPNNIYNLGNNMSQIKNTSPFKMNSHNLSQIELSKSHHLMEVEQDNNNNLKEEDQQYENLDYLQNDDYYYQQENQNNSYIENNYKSMNFNTDMKNSHLIESSLNNQNYSSLKQINNNNSNTYTTNYSQIQSKKQNIKKPTQKDQIQSQLESEQQNSQKMQKEELEKAMQKYFNISESTMNSLRNVDSLDNNKVIELAQQFGLKTGKDKLKGTKQALKDIAWFLKRNKMPDSYLLTYKPEIQEKVVSIPEDQLIQFQYKH